MHRVCPDDVTAARAVAGPARLEPFPAVRLSPARVGDPASARLLARPYRSVPERIERWSRLGNLERDTAPALYVHEFTSQGLTVRAVVGLVPVGPYAADPASAAVLPHEAVAPQQADDLAARLRTMRVNPAPLQLLHRGTEATRRVVTDVVGVPPGIDFVDRAGQRHRQWAVVDPDDVVRIQEALASRQLVVADGHHRLAAYQRLRDAEPDGPWRHALAMVVDHDDTPLFLGAIHRVLRRMRLDELVERAADLGTVRALTVSERVLALDERTVVLTDDTRAYALDLPASSPTTAVEVLHHDLLRDEDDVAVEYHHSSEAALRRLSAAQPGGEPRVAVLLPAVPYDVFAGVLAAGRRLPEKATSFQPKPSIGAMMRTF